MSLLSKSVCPRQAFPVFRTLGVQLFISFLSFIKYILIIPEVVLNFSKVLFNFFSTLNDKTGGMHPCSALFNEMSMVAEGKCSKIYQRQT